MCFYQVGVAHASRRYDGPPSPPPLPAPQYYLGLRIATFKHETVAVSDARIQRMHEILLAVKLVKFYVWERSFASQVAGVSGSRPGGAARARAACRHARTHP